MRNHRQHHIQLKVSGKPPHAHRRIVADHLRTDHRGRFLDHGVDLAGHDGRAGLQRGKLDFAQSAVGSGVHPAQIVGDLQQTDCHRLQLPAQLHRSVHRGLRLEVVFGLPERTTRQLGDFCGEFFGKLRMRVDARADGGSAHGQLRQPFQRRFNAFASQGELSGIASELLLQRDGHRVHQVGAACFDHMRVFLAFGEKGVLQGLQRGQQLLADFRVGRNA